MTTRRSFHPLFWTLAQVGSRVRADPPGGIEDPVLELPDLRTISVNTRHGDLRVLVQYPPATAAPAATSTAHGSHPHSAAPVIVHLHGGGFVNRHPEQDRHIARHLAAQLGAVVLLPDYSTAPAAQYPQAEEETYDLVRWVRTGGRRHGWDGERLVLSGVSAGAKLALNACQQLRTAAQPAPLALMLVVPVTDLVRTDRTSSARRPAISPLVQRFVGWAYIPDIARRSEPLASPRLDPALGAAAPVSVSSPRSRTPWPPRVSSSSTPCVRQASPSPTTSTPTPTTASSPGSPSVPYATPCTAWWISSGRTWRPGGSRELSRIVPGRRGDLRIANCGCRRPSGSPATR